MFNNPVDGECHWQNTLMVFCLIHTADLISEWRLSGIGVPPTVNYAVNAKNFTHTKYLDILCEYLYITMRNIFLLKNKIGHILQ